MAPPRKSNVEDEAEDDELDASQGTAFQKVIVQGLQDQKKRHAVNKQNVKQGHEDEKMRLQNDVVKLFDEHEDQAETAHRAQLTRLADLLARKASLEAQMTSKLTALRVSYDQHSKELTTILDLRVKELK